MTDATPTSRSTLCPLLIGRGPYIEILRQFCEQVRLGQGQTVILAGEPGIGKSRLAGETESMATQAGFTVLHSDCREDECAVPYAPLLRLLRQRLAGQPSLAHLWQAYAPQLIELLPELRAAWPDASPAGRAGAAQAHTDQNDALVGVHLYEGTRRHHRLAEDVRGEVAHAGP